MGWKNMFIADLADDICNFFNTLPEIRSSGLYGSVCNNSFDEYSDIDIEIDVSGTDNSRFVTKIPGLLSQKYDVIFYDYAPSLAPEKYLVSVALNDENPFMLVDIACTAVPHCTNVSKQELAALNHPYDHTLKLFTANLKHYLRGDVCCCDIQKMYRRISEKESLPGEKQMLQAVMKWLQEKAEPRHKNLLKRFTDFI